MNKGKGKGGWFVHNDSVSWCTIDDLFPDDCCLVKWQGQPIAIAKNRRFPTMLAAQLYVLREKSAKYIEDSASACAFYEEKSRSFEEKAELTDKAWFVEWNICETEYTVKCHEWRALLANSSMCEVQSDIALESLPERILWDLVRAEYRFKTEQGARFHAEAKLLGTRIKQEARLYQWLEVFGERVDEHNQEVDEFEV